MESECKSYKLIYWVNTNTGPRSQSWTWHTYTEPIGILDIARALGDVNVCHKGFSRSFAYKKKKKKKKKTSKRGNSQNEPYFNFVWKGNVSFFVGLQRLLGFSFLFTLR
jgi:hypothetical protein